MKRFLKRFLFAGASIIILTSCMFLMGYFTIPKRPVEIRIPFGASAYQAAGILRAEGLIMSRTLFMLNLHLFKGIHRIKAGTYMFSSRSLTPAIICTLMRGKSVLTKFTIPEGLTVRQTAETLSAHGFGKAQEFEEIFKQENLEGYLMPETYMVSPDLSVRQIIDTLRAQFDRTFTPAMVTRAQSLGFGKHEIVILASVIEKEAKVDFERPIISAVFHNRLKTHKYLESCATVQYALGTWKKRLSIKNLQIDSPYNTYKHFGLPPGPICSPGRRSIEAALYPAETNSLFFISNGDGTHSFHTRYRDHIKGKNEYKQMLKEYRERKNSREFK